MKNFLIVLITSITLFSCGNANQKEIAEVDGLLTLIEETEKSLLSIDTARVFATQRQMEIDFKEYTQFTDTITREEVFRVDEIVGSKKKFNRTTKNYIAFLDNVNYSKEQLGNLKTDLKNGLIKKEQFLIYFESEKSAFNGLTKKIEKSIGDFEVAIAKYELERPEFLQLIENRRQRAAENE